MSLIAVVDVETTGLNPYRHHRIVEIAVLLIEPDGTLVRQFASLVNPDRDIGPTSIHGLTMRDLIAAPRFAEIAGAILDAVDGCVAVAGHNIRFDHSFVAAEFERLGHEIPTARQLCTMHLAGGGNLLCACTEYGISFDGEAHSAWNDASATAKLLATLLKDEPLLTTEISRSRPITWPKIPGPCATPLTRHESRRRQAEPPTYIQKLLARRQPDLPDDTGWSAIMAYVGLLDRALEDRHIDDDEGQSLVEVAEHWGIPTAQIQRIHSEYLFSLAKAALADGVVTNSEQRDLQQVAALLGIGAETLPETLDIAAQALATAQIPGTALDVSCNHEELSGKSVCFTGECQCQLDGEPLTREVASDLATQHGMIVQKGVTKTLDMLVVADPQSQSGKAKKARDYGIRILHEPVFWRILGVHVE